MTTPAKNSCAFCPTPAHHMSVLHVLVHKMQLEALWGNRAFFLKCNYRGNRGRTWENSEELQRSAWICGDLWRAYSGLWELLASRRIGIKSKENAWTCNVPTSDFRGLHDFLAGVFLWFLTGIKLPQMTQNWCTRGHPKTVQ